MITTPGTSLSPVSLLRRPLHRRGVIRLLICIDLLPYMNVYRRVLEKYKYFFPFLYIFAILFTCSAASYSVDILSETSTISMAPQNAGCQEIPVFSRFFLILLLLLLFFRDLKAGFHIERSELSDAALLQNRPSSSDRELAAEIIALVEL